MARPFCALLWKSCPNTVAVLVRTAPRRNVHDAVFLQIECDCSIMHVHVHVRVGIRAYYILHVCMKTVAGGSATW